MQDFEVQKLCVISGKPGLWIFVTETGKGGMMHFKRLIDPFESATVKANKVNILEQFTIYTQTQQTYTVEDIFNNMLEYSEDVNFPTNFKKLDQSEQRQWMEKVVPDYHPEQFKISHMIKIWKWFDDLRQALDILDQESEDVYEEASETTGSESNTPETEQTAE